MITADTTIVVEKQAERSDADRVDSQFRTYRYRVNVETRFDGSDGKGPTTEQRMAGAKDSIILKGPYAPSIEKAIEGFLDDVTAKALGYGSGQTPTGKPWDKEPVIGAVGNVKSAEMSTLNEAWTAYNVDHRQWPIRSKMRRSRR